MLKLKRDQTVKSERDTNAEFGLDTVRSDETRKVITWRLNESLSQKAACELCMRCRQLLESFFLLGSARSSVGLLVGRGGSSMLVHFLCM